MSKVAGRILRLSNRNYTLELQDRVVLLESTGSYIITLPSVLDAAGRWFSFYASNITGVGSKYTISCAGSAYIRTDAGAVTTYDLSAAGNHLQLMSFGNDWFIISEG